MTPKSKEELKRLDSIRALKKLMTDAGVKVGHREQHIDYLLQEFTSYHQQQLERAVREARIDELEEAGKAVSQAYLDHRLPELQLTKEDKSNG